MGLKLPLALIAAIVVVDQLTKSWAVEQLTGQPSIEVLGKALMFTLVYNEGGAMGTSFGPSGYYLITAIIILPFLLWYTWKHRAEPQMSIPLACIAGGALGNVIDRLRMGKVVDFIDVDFFDINLFGYHLDRWWTFNIADAAITCAIAFILIRMLLPSQSDSVAGQPLGEPSNTAHE